MTIDPLASLLIGAFGASLIGLAGGLIGAWIQGRREHRRWIREQRLAAYDNFIRVADRVPKLDGSSPDSSKYATYPNDLKEALASLTLLGPDRVVMTGSLFTLHATLEAAKPSVAKREEFKGKSFTETILSAPGSEALDDMKGFTRARIAFVRAAQDALAIKSKMSKRQTTKLNAEMVKGAKA